MDSRQKILAAIPQSRVEWIQRSDPTSFFLKFPDWFRQKVAAVVPLSYEREWIVAIGVKEQLQASLLGYIYEDGALGILGCCNCLDDSAHSCLDNGDLWIAGMKAIRLETTMDPKEFEEIGPLNLFLCPYCNQLVRKWSTLLEDPTLNMMPQERIEFLNKYVKDAI